MMVVDLNSSMMLTVTVECKYSSCSSPAALSNRSSVDKWVRNMLVERKLRESNSDQLMIFVELSCP